MYITRFLDDPGHSYMYFYGDNEYDESIQMTIDNILDKLDRFVYLVDNYTIIQDCSRDLRSVRPQDGFDFWKVNKYLLNYLNAVFCYHEFIKYYKPSLKKIADEYWFVENGKFWYRFVCEYRDRVVHQSIIIKNYDYRKDIPYVNLDELIEIQKRVIATENREKYKERAQRFLDQIMMLYNSPHLVKNGKRYYKMTSIAQFADQEIDEMSNKVFKSTYRYDIKPALSKLLELVHFEDGENKLTYIVDKEKNESILEPTATIEWFYAKMIHSLGTANPVCEDIGSLLEAKGYCRYFEGYTELENLLKDKANADV